VTVKLPTLLPARPKRPKEPPALDRLKALDESVAPAQKPKSDRRGKKPKGATLAPAPDVEAGNITAAADRPAHPNRRRRILLAVWTTAVVVVAGLVLLLVLPTRAWLSQRSSIASAERRLQVLQDENAKLQARVAALQTPEQIEQVGREQYSLAKPGEKVFSVLPAPTLTNLPSGWPYELVGQMVAARAAAPAAAPPPSSG
jgi:cell division protein FtsB